MDLYIVTLLLLILVFTVRLSLKKYRRECMKREIVSNVKHELEKFTDCTEWNSTPDVSFEDTNKRTVSKELPPFSHTGNLQKRRCEGDEGGEEEYRCLNDKKPRRVYGGYTCMY